MQPAIGERVGELRESLEGLRRAKLVPSGAMAMTEVAIRVLGEGAVAEVAVHVLAKRAQHAGAFAAFESGALARNGKHVAMRSHPRGCVLSRRSGRAVRIHFEHCHLRAHLVHDALPEATMVFRCFPGAASWAFTSAGGDSN